MENDNAVSYSDFGEAFGMDGIRPEAEASDEPASTGAEGSTEAETPEQVSDDPDGKNGGTGGDQEPQETFTIKVNKEERTISREEAISLAQKGADYDRVKEQLEHYRNGDTELQRWKSEHEGLFSDLEALARVKGLSVPDLMKQFRVNSLTAQGLSAEAAAERVAREDAERQLEQYRASANAAKEAEQSQAERARREFAEFSQKFPGVTLTKEDIARLSEDVRGKGMTLTEAYQKDLSAAQAREIAQLREQLAARQKNRENLAASPGSQQDSGQSKPRNQIDEFWDAFK